MARKAKPEPAPEPDPSRMVRKGLYLDDESIATLHAIQAARNEIRSEGGAVRYLCRLYREGRLVDPEAS